MTTTRDHEGLIKEARDRLIKRASEIEAHVKKVPGWYPEAIQHAADIRLLLDALEARVLSPSEGDLGDAPSPSGSVWVVSGSTGEYSDRSEWMVFTFATEQAAKDYVGHLSERYRVLLGGLRRGSDEHALKCEEMREHDPQFDEDYTGTRWFVTEVPLHNTPPNIPTAETGGEG